jgi:hypothetical protein
MISSCQLFAASDEQSRFTLFRRHLATSCVGPSVLAFGGFTFHDSGEQAV